MSTARRYARRRANPFRGVEQVIDADSGRALSTDGVNWELQLLAPRPGGWGSLSAGATLEHARYGVWSAAEGLARYPHFPSLSDAPERAASLVREIEAAQAELPFALDDAFECWLCVGARPVALLATAARLPERRTPPPWRALPEDPAAASVEAAVVALRGGGQWFGPAAAGLKVSLGGTAPMTMPELPLDAEAFPASAREVVEAYLDRLAPRLLTLPLCAPTRARLERAACADAAGVAHFHRLYPEVCDPALITRLRVEARLRAAA